MQHYDIFDQLAIQTLAVLLIALAIWGAVEWSLRRRKPMARYRRYKRGTLPAPRPECRRDYTHEFFGR